MPKVYNIRKDHPPDCVYIGRGSPWGNPYPITNDISRTVVLEMFEHYTLRKLNLEPLRGKNLLCHCAPLRCHGDIILKRLECTEIKDGE